MNLSDSRLDPASPAGLRLSSSSLAEPGLPCSFGFPLHTCHQLYSGGLPGCSSRSLRPVSPDSAFSSLTMPAFSNLNWVGVRIAFSKLYRWVCFVSHWRPVAFHGALRYAGQSKCRFFRHLL